MFMSLSVRTRTAGWFVHMVPHLAIDPSIMHDVQHPIDRLPSLCGRDCHCTLQKVPAQQDLRSAASMHDLHLINMQGKLVLGSKTNLLRPAMP